MTGSLVKPIEMIPGLNRKRRSAIPGKREMEMSFGIILALEWGAYLEPGSSLGVFRTM